MFIKSPELLPGFIIYFGGFRELYGLPSSIPTRARLKSTDPDRNIIILNADLNNGN